MDISECILLYVGSKHILVNKCILDLAKSPSSLLDVSEHSLFISTCTSSLPSSKPLIGSGETVGDSVSESVVNRHYL